MTHFDCKLVEFDGLVYDIPVREFMDTPIDELAARYSLPPHPAPVGTIQGTSGGFTGRAR